MKKYRVLVKLKPNVLDPEGNTIKQAAERMGVQGLQSLRTGKVFEIETDDSMTREKIEELAKKVLINPVIQTFEVEG
ncbi:MAG: phosphoribosylformylglycinamidine synthase, purS protein [Spirochaetes bacterium GWB1_36_13]|nr:MAG: phosphoribosylformylglycinamidine synthase, purS protein [Spirochaetes bacterium GWB1_36_13]